jgi:hypothetical protein
MPSVLLLCIAAAWREPQTVARCTGEAVALLCVSSGQVLTVAPLGTTAALPRTVWILGLISLVNDAASDLIDPLLPPISSRC